MPRRERVLLAEDDHELRAALVDILEGAGFEVLEAGDATEVKEYAETCFLLNVPRRRVDVLVSDIRMPGMNGLCLLEYVRELGWDVPAVLITAFGGPETHELARELGAHAVLEKPFAGDELERILREALDEGPTAR